MAWQDELQLAVLQGDEVAVEETGRAVLEAGADPAEVLQRGADGIVEAGRLWQEGEYFLPDVILAAEAYRRVMEMTASLLGEAGAGKGTVVIGTVEGDAHEIGKNLVVAMLRSAGYRVEDLGIDVSVDDFVRSVRDLRPDVLGLGAYMTTSMRRIADVIAALEGAGLREAVKVVVGGAPVTRDHAASIGADGYGADAPEAVRAVDALLGVER